MAAGTSSRFVPLSAEIPKGLLEVKGEILIERQIMQLKEAGINDITIVTGYKAEMFKYLENKFGVELVLNEDYQRYNNTSSVICVLDRMKDTYICSSDNYFTNNVFCEEPRCSYYSALYAAGETKEYCLKVDEADNITDVTVGGKDSWYMIGHVYFSNDFSRKFKEILAKEYEKKETRQGYWEDVYIKFLNQLPPMKIHRYSDDAIHEFDSIDELRTFDKSYIRDTRSNVLKNIAFRLNCIEASLSQFEKIHYTGEDIAFSFIKDGEKYLFDSSDQTIRKL